MRHYYKSLDGNGFYNFKSKISSNDTRFADLVEITEEEFKTLTKSFVSPNQETLNEIAKLKQGLSATDYKCLKYVDGALSEEEYAEVREYRASLRAQINELEKNIII